MTTNATAPAVPAKATPRPILGESYRVWLDGAARERLGRLRRLFSGTMGATPTNSTIVRAALKALADRADCVADLGPEGAELGLLALRNDIREAAEGREVA